MEETSYAETTLSGIITVSFAVLRGTTLTRRVHVRAPLDVAPAKRFVVHEKGEK